MESDSILSDYYPSSFKCDTYFKRYFWECYPILLI